MRTTRARIPCHSQPPGENVKIVKGVVLVLVVAFIVIQFIRPERNDHTRPAGTRVTDLFQVPDSVQGILQTSCYDCHSDSTRYPWYFSVQPVAWFLADHIHDGRRGLNFDEYALYRPFQQFGKLVQIERHIRNGSMPLPSYLLIHRDAVLSQEKKDMLIAWTEAMRDTLKTRYPLDSLERRRPRGNGGWEGERERGRM
jgi:hypothetical protein